MLLPLRISVLCELILHSNVNCELKTWIALRWKQTHFMVYTLYSVHCTETVQCVLYIVHIVYDECMPEVSVNPIRADIVQTPALLHFVWFVPLPLNYLFFGLDIRLDLQLMLFAMKPNPNVNMFNVYSIENAHSYGKPKPEKISILSSLLILALLIFIRIKWKAIKMFRIQFSQICLTWVNFLYHFFRIACNVHIKI